MRLVPWFIKLPALLLWFACAPASSAGELPADARSLATLFVDAWNSHDAASFAVLLADDADWVTASGLRLNGRESIRAYLSVEHATWAKRTRMQASNIQVRALNENTSIVSFEWAIATPGEGGGKPSVARGNNLFVAIDKKGWVIISGQVARVRTQ